VIFERSVLRRRCGGGRQKTKAGIFLSRSVVAGSSDFSGDTFQIFLRLAAFLFNAALSLLGLHLPTLRAAN
jgi:hypothetical protein